MYKISGGGSTVLFFVAINMSLYDYYGKNNKKWKLILDLKVNKIVVTYHREKGLCYYIKKMKKF